MLPSAGMDSQSSIDSIRSTGTRTTLDNTSRSIGTQTSVDNTKSNCPQSTMDKIQSRDLVDPNCIFDPDIVLLPSQREGFHLLFPDWHERNLLERPTIREMKRMLEEVELARITKRSVILADTALTPFPYSPSAKKDSTRWRKKAHLPVDTTLTASADTENNRAFDSRHGHITVKDILGAVHYLKGVIATWTDSEFINRSHSIFQTGLMATRLEDIQFVFRTNECEMLKESLCKAAAGDVPENKEAADAILAAVGYKDNNEVTSCFWRIDQKKSVFASENYKMDEVEIGLVKEWLSGKIWQPLLLCTAITRHLFGYPGDMLDQLSLNTTIKDAVALDLFGPPETRKVPTPKQTVTLEELIGKGYVVDVINCIDFTVRDRKIVIGKFTKTQLRIAACISTQTGELCFKPTPVREMMFIYRSLCCTPSSFKLAIEMGIFDYDDFTSVISILFRISYIDDPMNTMTSSHGYEYVKLCNEFFSWRHRIRRDFSNSLTRDAFALLVTMTALIVSFTGIIQVVQGFLKN